MSFDLFIKNGKVIGPQWVKEVDIGIEGEVITYIGNSLKKYDAARIIDATGKIVSPGGIDPHTHFETNFMGSQVPETWEKGSIAAAFGGTTSVLDFAGLEKEEKGDTIEVMINRKLERAKKLSTIDYAVKPILKNAFYKTVDDLSSIIKGLVSTGIPAFKVFMAYRKQGLNTDDMWLYEIMKVVHNENAILQIHAENGMIEEANQNRFISEGKTEAIYHYYAKPNFVENLAIQTAMVLAEVTKSPTYIVHQSTKEGLEIISNYRMKGLSVFDETCPHYLTRTRKYLEDKIKGRHYIMSPPLRDSEDILALWNGLNIGKIQTVGSDHVAYTIAQKEEFAEFTKVPNGTPGVETRLPIVFSEGVRKGRITLSRFAEVTSTNVAKIFGLYPKKGTIQVGSDADLVLIDPNFEHKMRAEDLHTDSDLSIYDDMTSKGWPTHTILRGEVIVEDGSFYGKAGNGKYLTGKVDTSLLAGVW
ncbi:MAG: dihydropyrimidinase [Nitrososphaeria archaeon]